MAPPYIKRIEEDIATHSALVNLKTSMKWKNSLKTLANLSSHIYFKEIKFISKKYTSWTTWLYL